MLNVAVNGVCELENALLSWTDNTSLTHSLPHKLTYSPASIIHFSPPQNSSQFFLRYFMPSFLIVYIFSLLLFLYFLFRSSDYCSHPAFLTSRSINKILRNNSTRTDYLEINFWNHKYIYKILLFMNQSTGGVTVGATNADVTIFWRDARRKSEDHSKDSLTKQRQTCWFRKREIYKNLNFPTFLKERFLLTWIFPCFCVKIFLDYINFPLSSLLNGHSTLFLQWRKRK